jgi:hypothetical protein
MQLGAEGVVTGGGGGRACEQRGEQGSASESLPLPPYHAHDGNMGEFSDTAKGGFLSEGHLMQSVHQVHTTQTYFP